MGESEATEGGDASDGGSYSSPFTVRKDCSDPADIKKYADWEEAYATGKPKYGLRLGLKVPTDTVPPFMKAVYYFWHRLNDPTVYWPPPGNTRWGLMHLTVNSYATLQTWGGGAITTEQALVKMIDDALRGATP